MDSPHLRCETKINNEEKIGEKIEPNIEFKSICNQIISNLTVQDVFDMFNLRFKGISRIRKNINKIYFSEKEKNEEIVKKVAEILGERFILIENQLDKLNPNKEFNTELFFYNHLKEIFNIFIDETIINKSDDEWEVLLHNLILNMLKDLINELKEVYETAEDGAKTYIEFNINILIENLVGQKMLEKIQKYDEDIILKFVENIFLIVKSNEIKSKMEDKKEENVEKPTLLTIDEIFKIAMKDKERLEKEEKENKEKENNEENQDKKKYSDFYYMTSLFKK